MKDILKNTITLKANYWKKIIDFYFATIEILMIVIKAITSLLVTKPSRKNLLRAGPLQVKVWLEPKNQSHLKLPLL